MPVYERERNIPVAAALLGCGLVCLLFVAAGVLAYLWFIRAFETAMTTAVPPLPSCALATDFNPPANASAAVLLPDRVGSFILQQRRQTAGEFDIWRQGWCGTYRFGQQQVTFLAFPCTTKRNAEASAERVRSRLTDISVWGRGSVGSGEQTTFHFYGEGVSQAVSGWWKDNWLLIVTAKNTTDREEFLEALGNLAKKRTGGNASR